MIDVVVLFADRLFHALHRRISFGSRNLSPNWISIVSSSVCGSKYIVSGRSTLVIFWLRFRQYLYASQDSGISAFADQKTLLSNPIKKATAVKINPMTLDAAPSKYGLLN